MGIRRKNLNIDQSKLDRAKKVLGASTETEAVDTALDSILFAHDVRAGLEELAGSPIEPIFATEEELAILDGL